MTNKKRNQIHLKRNNGINLYTHIWYLINTLFDDMRHMRYIEKKARMISKAKYITKNFIWNRLPYEEQERLYKAIPSECGDIKHIILQSLEFKKKKSRANKRGFISLNIIL